MSEQSHDKHDSLLMVAAAYKDLWLICHENTPREPKMGEHLELGHLRGKLFAAIAASSMSEIIAAGGKITNISIRDPALPSAIGAGASCDPAPGGSSCDAVTSSIEPRADDDEAPLDELRRIADSYPETAHVAKRIHAAADALEIALADANSDINGLMVRLSAKPVSAIEPWIACSERLPELGAQVLIWPHAKSGNKYDSPVGYYDEFGMRKDCKRGFKCFGEFVEVTHWKPLPQGPRASSDGETPT